MILYESSSEFVKKLHTENILAGLFIGVIFRIEFLTAFRADPVAEGGIRMLMNIGFDLVPVASVIADFFT